jgi:hypothetical protein
VRDCRRLPVALTDLTTACSVARLLFRPAVDSPDSPEEFEEREVTRTACVCFRTEPGRMRTPSAASCSMLSSEWGSTWKKKPRCRARGSGMSILFLPDELISGSRDPVIGAKNKFPQPRWYQADRKTKSEKLNTGKSVCNFPASSLEL